MFKEGKLGQGKKNISISKVACNFPEDQEMSLLIHTKNNNFGISLKFIYLTGNLNVLSWVPKKEYRSDIKAE